MRLKRRIITTFGLLYFRNTRNIPRTVLSRDITVIIPTINSANYIDIVVNFYREQGIDVFLFIDSKTSDGTIKVLSALKSKFDVIENASTRVGEIIESISMAADTPWILRMDDDELPSLGMIDFISNVIRHANADVYGFPRLQCSVAKDGCLLVSKDVDMFVHRQWRLYRRSAVTYAKDGHTPGFKLEGLKTGPAPNEAVMIHLDWIVHSLEDRRRKVERYDSHTSGHGSTWRSYYIPEELTGFEDQFRRLYMSEFRNVSEAIAKRMQVSTINRYSMY